MPPLGRWLTDDFLVSACAATDGTLRSGAALLAIPESTFGRWLLQAEAEAARRSSDWDTVRPLVTAVLRAPERPGSDLLDRFRRLILEEIAAAVPEDVTAGAALMGVAVRTFRSWRRAL